MNPTRIEFDHRAWLAHGWALVDPVGVEAHLWSDLPSTVLRPSAFQFDDAVLPSLVHLEGLVLETSIAVMERAGSWLADSGRPLFGGMLDVEGSSGTIAAHLEGRMRVPRTGGGSFWLRFHDHRVFGHLVRILTSPQLAYLLGPVRGWTWFDPCLGEWLRIERPDVPATSLRSLDSGQWQKLQRIELLNAVASSLRREPGSTRLCVASLDRLDLVLASVLSSAPNLGRHEICRRAERGFLEGQLLNPFQTPPMSDTEVGP